MSRGVQETIGSKSPSLAHKQSHEIQISALDRNLDFRKLAVWVVHREKKRIQIGIKIFK
jgi:hypothetical protein